MMNHARQRNLFLIAGAFCLVVSACHGAKKTSANPPNVESLRQSLQRVAESALPTPSLISQRIVIEVKPGEIDSKGEEIKRIGAELGATVFPGPDQADSTAKSGASFLLRMREDQMAEFARRAQAVSSAPTAKLKENAPSLQFETHLANPVESVLVEVHIQVAP